MGKKHNPLFWPSGRRAPPAVRGAVVPLSLALALWLAAPAAAVELIYPADRLSVRPTPTLAWRLAPGEQSGSISVFRDPAQPDDPVWSRRLLPAARAIAVDRALELGTYYWQVKARDASHSCVEPDFNCASSGVRQFLVIRPPLKRLKVTVHRVGHSRGRTRFMIERSRYANVSLAILRFGRRVVSLDFPGSVSDRLQADYRWTCRRAGRHRWQVLATDVYGTEIVREGIFSTPRCYVLRPTAITHTEQRKQPQFVSHVSCRPRGKRRHGRARTWRCGLIWNDLRRECRGTYAFSRTLEFRSGSPRRTSHWRERRLGPVRCREFFSGGLRTPRLPSGAPLLPGL